MASASPVTDVEEEATCPICLEVLTDPVTLGCHHNFCRGCITDYCDKWEDLGDLECPVCRVRMRGRKFQRNYQLANIVENVQRAKKHLCAQHLKELNLFCKEDDELLCVACERSPEHELHTVLLLEEAAQEYKENIQEQLQSLEKKREELVEQKESEVQRNQEYLKQLEEQKLKITSDFMEMHKFLEEKEHIWLRELADLEIEIKERQEEYMTRLSEEISHFRNLITDLEEKCRQPASEILQDIRRTLSRCREGRVRQRLKLPPGPEQWRLRSASLKSSALKTAMKEFQGSLEQAEGKVSVTLDPDTAHRHLVLSEDLKSVRCELRWQKLPDSPERFDSVFCVLGRERFTSGRHWWEVKVEKLTERERWAVGVARESFKRKEYSYLSPTEGIWAVGKDILQHLSIWRRISLMFSGEFNERFCAVLSALTFPKWTPLTLSHEPRKIRVFLDYEEGHVEFFDADTDHLIFSFAPGSFSGEGIRPFFWVHEGVSLQC